jgi:hypothetical protein
MTKTSKALWASIISALIIGGVYYVSSKYIFNNPALISLNNMEVGITVVIAVFLVGFIGMKWSDWSR